MTGDDPVQVPPALALDAAAPTHAPPRDGDTATDDAPTAAGDPRVAQPLSGIVVLDLSRYLPGPLTARILADLGARVIKIEEPRMGDPVRQAPPVRGDTSSLAALLLGGVESLAIDLTTDLGRDALEQLMGEADVLLESFRPGTMARFGLDPAALRQRHPHLVICSISGWGQDGPTRTRAGHDLSYQAIAGTLAAGPAGAMPAVPTADVVGAWSAATSILAALVRRAQRTEDGVVRADPPSTTVEASAAPAADAPRGDGVWIDASLLDAAAHAAITAWAAEADQAHAVGDPLPLTGALPGYNLYRTADDGHVALAVLEPRFWTRFCQQVERPDLIPRSFSRDPVVRDKVARIIAGRTRSAWATFFAAHDLPGAPVLSLAEARNHPQMRARGLTRHGADGLIRLAHPARFDGHRPRAARGDVPALGADTEALVAAFDLAPALSPRQQRKRGLGRKRSVRRWVSGLLNRLTSGRRAADDDGTDDDEPTADDR